MTLFLIESSKKRSLLRLLVFRLQLCIRLVHKTGKFVGRKFAGHVPLHPQLLFNQMPRKKESFWDNVKLGQPQQWARAGLGYIYIYIYTILLNIIIIDKMFI